ncbi:hypothetical protein PATSB16_12120 [Pandoraea thiooxydans]|nr:hypothetical protein PATSB16_12120 [Pandoraea thiooxydans]
MRSAHYCQKRNYPLSPRPFFFAQRRNRLILSTMKTHRPF